jgi:type IX secretion system PorP/SprF family membrane protein
MKKLITLLLFTNLFVSSKAQQVEAFSLVRENAFVLNPAMAGMNGWIHGTATFRKQFTRIDQSPYTTNLAIDGEILGKNVGVGGYLLHDVTGPTGKSAISMSVAYHIPLYKKRGTRYSNKKSPHNLSIGVALTAVQYRLRGDQLNPNDLNDPELYTSRGNRIFPDASIGVYYRYKNNFYAGFSAPQILGLNINYRGSDGLAKIKRVQHLNVLLGGKIEFNRGNFSLDPVGAFRWVKGAPPQGDIGLRFWMYKVFFVGANYKSTNFMVFEGGINVFNKFSLSYGYDYNFATYRRDMGATHEISMSFTVNKSSKVFRGAGPALRY